jgi:hypothetical protein
MVRCISPTGNSSVNFVKVKMVRFSGILIHLGCVLILASLSTSATSLADVDIKLKQLAENYVRISFYFSII